MLVVPEDSSKRNLCHKEFKTLPKDVRFPPMFTIGEINALISHLGETDVQMHQERPEPETAIEIDDDEEKNTSLSFRKNKR